MHLAERTDKNINPSSVFVSAETAIEAFRRGEILILIDDEERENEGDFVVAAEHITPEAINFMTQYGRGLICVSISEERAKELNLKPMVKKNTARLGTAFTESVDAVKNTTTGISAFDRAETVRALANPQTALNDLARPGHVFPLIANPGGVIARPGHTEAVFDLAKTSQLEPAGVLCEILDDDGSMARLPKLISIAEQFDLKIASVEDIITYRCKHENLIREVTRVDLPTIHGNFQLHLYESTVNESEHHIAMVKGNVREDEPVLVRIHSECLTGDTLGSLRCDCGDQLHAALEKIESEEKGVVLYLKQEGRGIGLVNKIKAYQLQDEGKDTVEANEALGFKADLREYWFAAQMLKELSIGKVRLMTNNPNKVKGISKYDIKVVERVPIEMNPNPLNRKYLQTKKEKLGHLIGLEHQKDKGGKISIGDFLRNRQIKSTAENDT